MDGLFYITFGFIFGKGFDSTAMKQTIPDAECSTHNKKIIFL